jgi:hypothetical protein
MGLGETMDHDMVSYNCGRLQRLLVMVCLFIMYAALLAMVLFLSGCTLTDNHSRKVTAWGVWCTAAACGIGYWHSERGPGENILSEESAKPFLPRLASPIMK